MSTARLPTPRRGLPRLVVTLVVVAACWVLGFIVFSATLEADGIDLARTTPEQDARVVADLVAGTVASILVVLVRSRRRRRVLIGTMLIVVAGIVSTWATPALVLAVCTVSSWRSLRSLVLVDLGALASLAASILVMDDRRPAPSDLVIGAALLLALNLWGVYRGQKVALVDAYHQHALALERAASATEREHRARLAQVRADERTAIAQEMHDTLSHRLSIISLHASGLASRPDLPPKKIAETAGMLADVARTGSEELRSLLSVLRDPADRTHAVGIDKAASLIAEARSIGLSVDLHCEASLGGALDELSPHRSVALAQALHEGLANATKHAADQPVTVVLRQDDGVRLEVTNPLSPTPSSLPGGFGLVGLDERLRLAGGTLRHGTVDGRHELVAWVPW